jgi:hypothetical protein
MQVLPGRKLMIQFSFPVKARFRLRASGNSRRTANHPSVREHLSKPIYLSKTIKSHPMTFRKAYFDLSPAQHEIWLKCQRARGSVAHNLSTAFIVQGPLDTEAFDRAAEQVIRRHEILRTNFVAVKGIPRQQVRMAEDISFRIQQNEGAEELDPCRIVHMLASRRFNLESDLLLKAHLVQMEQDEQLLLLTTHRLVMDEESLQLLVRQIVDAYNAYLQQDFVEMPLLSPQFRHYAQWLNEEAEGNRKAAKYWAKALEDFQPATVFPPDQESPVFSYTGERLVFEVLEDRAEELKEFARQQGCSMMAVFTAMLKVLMMKYSGRKDLCVGTTLSERRSAMLSDQLGLYTHTVALRNTLAPRASFYEWMVNVQANLEGAAEYREYPFQKALDLSGPAFDIMITYKTQDPLYDEVLAAGESPLYPFDIPHRTSRYPLSFGFFEEQDMIFCNLDYNSTLYRSETIHIIIEKFEKLAYEIMADPGKAIGEYDISLDIEEELRDEISISLDF